MRFAFVAAAVCLAVNLFTSVAAANDVAFAYQGRVKVQGQPFSGTGQFKFSIVDTSGNTTLWSHDNTGENGEAPTGHLPLSVDDGIFNVIIGDTSIGMSPINSTIFNSQTPLKLRVWFNDGVLGFQKLNPDHNLVNLTLTVLETGVQDFTIYVNGATGDDQNNGLTPTSPKKTIQAAVDTLPDRIKCNVTIDVADGIYRESVRLFGLSVVPGKLIKIVGDETWAPGAGNPAVRVTGTDNDGAPTAVRDYGFIAVQCSGVEIQGFLVDYYSDSAIQLDNGIYIVKNCKATNSNYGIFAAKANVVCSQVVASQCTQEGLYATNHTSIVLKACTSTNNSLGLTLNAGSNAFLQGAGNYSFNTFHGYKVQHHSAIVFAAANPGLGVEAHSATVAGNGQYGLAISYQSFSENHTTNVWGVGASANGIGNIFTIFGGITTY